eukprot:scaffold454_cov124-Isochrysis_galbana.AAC.15
MFYHEQSSQGFIAKPRAGWARGKRSDDTVRRGVGGGEPTRTTRQFRANAPTPTPRCDACARDLQNSHRPPHSFSHQNGVQ